MVAVIRLARVVLTLVLALLTISFVIAVARPETGILEKAVLLTFIIGCVVAAAKVATWSSRAQARITRS